MKRRTYPRDGLARRDPRHDAVREANEGVLGGDEAACAQRVKVSHRRRQRRQGVPIVLVIEVRLCDRKKKEDGPMCAMSVMSAICLRYTLLPLKFAPFSSGSSVLKTQREVRPTSGMTDRQDDRALVLGGVHLGVLLRVWLDGGLTTDLMTSRRTRTYHLEAHHQARAWADGVGRTSDVLLGTNVSTHSCASG